MATTKKTKKKPAAKKTKRAHPTKRLTPKQEKRLVAALPAETNVPLRVASAPGNGSRRPFRAVGHISNLCRDRLHEMQDFQSASVGAILEAAIGDLYAKVHPVMMQRRAQLAAGASETGDAMGAHASPSPLGAG